MRAETRYAEFVVLHPVGSVDHVVHSSAFRAQNNDTLFFTLGWDWYAFDKKMRWDTLRQTCVFTFGRIHRSRSAFH
jgi:hypothetical protein